MVIAMFVDSVVCKNIRQCRDGQMAIRLPCFSSVTGGMIMEIGQTSSPATVTSVLHNYWVWYTETYFLLNSSCLAWQWVLQPTHSTVRDKCVFLVCDGMENCSDESDDLHCNKTRVRFWPICDRIILLVLIIFTIGVQKRKILVWKTASLQTVLMCDEIECGMLNTEHWF